MSVKLPLQGLQANAAGGSPRKWLLGFGALLIFLLLIFAWSQCSKESDIVALPDFTAYKNIEGRKAAFLEFLLPFIEEANERIRRERKHLLELEKDFATFKQLSDAQMKRLRSLETRYGFNPNDGLGEQTFVDLLSRVDSVPPSLALAQAALETGWGTSRFAREGNNLFGVWCYDPGCGIVPERRPPDQAHEVKRYESPKDSCLDYIHNLNTNVHYGSLRAIRRALRRQGIEPNGFDLAEGLDRYSEEGFAYIRKVQDVMRSNKLQEYDS